MASQAFINEAYLAYFGRPADPGGMAYYASSSEYEIERGFSASAESEALYGSTFGYDQVNLIYNTLFNHDADIDGMNWYVNEVLNGRMLPAEVAVKILQGAQGSDLVIVENKLAAAEMFTSHLNTTQEYVGYAGYAATASARAYLATIGSTAATATEVDTAILEACTASSGSGKLFTLTDTTVAGVKAMVLTGDQDVRIDMTSATNQITGLDLDGDGVIENNGLENALNVKPAAGYAAVDAYTRLTNGVVDETNLSKVFLGDIRYDGSGNAGDGVSTDGNIVLGGLGADTILGGIGNDFLAAGGIAQSHAAATESLSGGRNADFMFAELSLLTNTDGNKLFVDGGATADDTSAANGQSTQDSDWLLLQASDDDERIEITLTENAGTVGTTPVNDGTLTTRAGQYATLRDIENLDASGNTYGFLKGLTTTVGGAPTNANNNGIGSSGQLNVTGSAAANIIVGGYDNDAINAGAGNDIVMGGNLKSYADDGVAVAHQILDPNLVGLVGNNDGRDELTGGAGSDNILFEADGGIIEGGATQNVDDTEVDTLWLTQNSLGATVTAAAVTPVAASALTTDSVLRFDLAAGKAGGLDNASGYGGADMNAATGGYTADQTKYINTALRVQTQDMENVVATGLGAVDYKAAGGNSAADLTFQNQQNFQRYSGDLDLRGTYSTVATTVTSGTAPVPGTSALNTAAAVTTVSPDGVTTVVTPVVLIAGGAVIGAQTVVTTPGATGANTLYASEGDDILEGRTGNDLLSGGNGDDDFVFYLQDNLGDGVDVIHRQADANNDNIWDNYGTILGANGQVIPGVGTFVQDFGQVSAAVTANSKLTLTLIDSAHPADLTGFPVDGVAFSLDGVAYTVTLTSGIQSTYTAFNDGLNAALDANPALAHLQSVLNADNTMTITDPAGKTFVASGYTFVGDVVPPAGILVWDQDVGGPSVTQTQDRLIYRSYEDRADGESVDDDAITGSIISLGNDAYAEDLVINFSADGTRIAEDQAYNLVFANLTTQDKVSIAVNGVTYSLQVGVDLDGNSIAAEDGVGDTQVGIQTAFLARLNAFINSFMDNDTAAGQVTSTIVNAATTLQLTQAMYNTEETVFMTTPVVTLQNLSNGEVATAVVTNVSEHEVHLLNYDGRNLDGSGVNLDGTNVLFVGDTNVNQALLQTAKNLTGGTITGTDADLVDGGANDLAGIVNNTATNANLATNFSVHGDDFILGGAAVDTIRAGTGDDRVQGSGGNDFLDGGKNYYAVKVLGETESRVVTWNVWEAANPTSAQSLLADPTLAGKTLTSITLIGQSEDGSTVISGAFNDTLIYAQNDFTTGATRFTVTLNNYTVTAGVVALNNGGAGTVGVDLTGDGTIDSTSTFTNFENVRTVSGTGLAVAGVGGGQGNDTLDVSALSTSTGGVSYDLTNRNVALPTSTAGDVRYSTNVDVADGGGDIATALFADENDFETAVIKVDGVESVIAGLGNDLLMIDESEAAKNNSFTAGLGADRIEYLNDFAGRDTAVALTTAINTTDTIVTSAAYLAAQTLVNANAYLAAANVLVVGGALTAADIAAHIAAATQAVAAETAVANEPAAEPSVTIKVNAAADTDTVVMTGGRVGSVEATDTLVSVERIALNGFTAEGSRENDVIDVTMMATGAVVDFTNGQVRDLAGVAQVTIENIAELENVWADGNDTVIVADNMGALNAREDVINGTASQDIALATFIDYDELSVATATLNKRIAFASQTSAQIENVVNQNQYTFDLSKVGTDADTDTVDYSGTLTAVNNDNIAVRVELDVNQANQYVLVDVDGAVFGGAGDLVQAGDRIDVLTSVERIVASTGESVLDLTASSKALEVKYQALDLANRVASLDRDVFNVMISDLSSSVPLTRTYVEYRDAGVLAGTAAVPNQVSASWNRVEGSDFAERIVMNSAHSANNNTMNLRGGANEVKYNELTRSITTTLNVVDYSAAAALASGLITATVQFQDGTGAGSEGPMLNVTTDTITSYTANNGIAAGSLRIAASQDAEDTLKFAGLSDKLFLISETGTTDNQITVKLGSGAAENSIILTGFELISDAAGNDVYDFGSLVNASAGLNFIDAGPDHDTVKVGNDAAAAAFGGNATTISLAGINATVALAPAGFDFDVLDVTKVTDAGITTLTGVVGGEGTDEVVLGALNGLTNINNFESVVLTQATVTGQGTTFVLNTTANTLVAGAKTLTFNQNMNTLSFGGLALEGALGASTALNATGNLTVTVVGNEDVTLIGGNGNDSLTGNGGSDTLVGGAGDDILNGGFTAATGPIYTVTIPGVGTTSGVAGSTMVIGGLTITSAAVPVGPQVVVSADADQIGAAFAAQSLPSWQAALFAAGGLTALQAATLTSVTYNATTNALAFAFSTSNDAALINAALITNPSVAGATMAATEADTQAWAAQIESQDDYIFGATAALNGVDTINNFNLSGAVTDDILDFSKFLTGNYETNAAVNSTAGINLGGGTNTTQDIAVMFNKAALSAADIVVNTAFVAGKIGLADNGKAVVLVTADDNGVADVVTNNAYDVYYVEDTNALVGATAQTFAVTKVATINSTAELNATAFANMGRVLTGTAAADVMAGGTGADRIQGNGGADTITLGVDAAADTVVYAATTDGTTLPNAGVGVADTVANFVAANDTVALTGDLKGLVDDITIDNVLAFTSAAGGVGIATAVNLATTVEALFVSGAENATITAANLGDKALVIAKLNLEFAETVAAGGGSDALLVLESSDVAGTFGVYYWKDDIGDGFDAADTLVLLGVVTGDAVTTADFSLI